MESKLILDNDEKKQLNGSIISFKAINYKISSSYWKKKEKQILFDLNGIFQPGMNAVLGPTGCGKSTLLDLLANRKNSRNLTGEIYLDGQIYHEHLNSRIGYVVQDDILSETLTVRENLMFSANLRLSEKISLTNKQDIVELVITQLGLERCANSKIGSQTNRKISGGERKRTNIGMELILSPTVLILDEPTSGLDSSTANSVIECLSQLAQKGNTIIFSIHQPRYSIYKLFNNLYVIANGHCIYHGSVDNVLQYFSSIGLTCEEHDNPADFILDVCQGIRQISSSLIHHDSIQLTDEKQDLSQYLNHLYIQSSIFNSIEQQIENLKQCSTNEIKKTKEKLNSKSYFNEMFYVFQRSFRNSFRNSTLMIMQTIVPICVALLVGLLYMNTDKTIENGVKNRLGAIFFIVSNEVFLNLSALELFMKERLLFAHENASGYYRVTTYFISKLLCDILLLRLIPSIVFSLISYFLIQFQRIIDKYLIYQLAIFSTAVCSASVCFFVSATVQTIGVANLVTSSICIVMLVFTGYLVDINNVVEFLSWIKWLSIFRYSSNVLTINEFTKIKFCLINNTNSCFTKGETILENNHIDYLTNWDLWKNFVALTAITIFFFGLTFIQLFRIHRKNHR